MLRKCWVTYLPQASAGSSEVRTASTAVLTRSGGLTGFVRRPPEPLWVVEPVVVLVEVEACAEVELELELVSPPPPHPASAATTIARPSAAAPA
jgi:hypothetical protein